ncbi:hypothetical protein CSHISOI_08985 [Colletotrichum shisoi]|uniref:Uncharacterized protein n=1 Tax=Colletotrichum shisoi TaxID=2078593 RepID=A0A5Q4BIN0_9PEZI|nr:hypothetical protein CSHISOI_08985 [Colletotrichum shisoi]
MVRKRQVDNQPLLSFGSIVKSHSTIARHRKERALRPTWPCPPSWRCLIESQKPRFILATPAMPGQPASHASHSAAVVNSNGVRNLTR